ncbi:MAG: hypothetical protein RBR52_03910 [Thiomonas sp.]|uniref:hypothetical protein n=1 Tax=Thiomonas sp. TaxID=2047785 RepID=UPI002A36F204|nr:hypothetical protein [Thiomonas sp.]MDY0329626.1 hypothetical protein [Thiomonas sp.]
MALRPTLIAALLALGGVCTAHAEPALTVGNTLSFFQGKFGTNNNINIRYDATDIQYGDGNDWRVKLTVPYVSESGLPVGSTLSGNTVVGGGSSTQTHSASGLGDVWLAGHYKIFQGVGLTPSITPYAKIKFGTASSDNGLGTGKNDYELGVGLQQIIGNNWFPFANLGYRFVGNPTGQNLRNIAVYQLGASYAASQQNIFTLMYAAQQALVAGAPAPSDLIAAWNYNLTPNGSGFQVYVDKGLSHSSANFGVGIGGQIVF